MHTSKIAMELIAMEQLLLAVKNKIKVLAALCLLHLQKTNRFLSPDKQGYASVFLQRTKPFSPHYNMIFCCPKQFEN